MTVTAEQWAAVANDIGITVEELRGRIAELDNSWAAKHPTREYEPTYFDRDGDPLSLGEWAWLYEAPSYKFIVTTTLPNHCWVATIWHGVRDFDDDGNVLETSVFPEAPAEGKPLLPSIERVTHASMDEALRVHSELADKYRRMWRKSPRGSDGLIP
jgi:hypothetical protein